MGQTARLALSQTPSPGKCLQPLVLFHSKAKCLLPNAKVDNERDESLDVSILIGDIETVLESLEGSRALPFLQDLSSTHLHSVALAQDITTPNAEESNTEADSMTVGAGSDIAPSHEYEDEAEEAEGILSPFAGDMLLKIGSDFESA